MDWKSLNINTTILMFLAFFTYTCELNGEVENVTMSWTRSLCDQKCGDLIAQKLHMISGINQVQINIPEKRAILSWKPKSAFSYREIKTAMQAVGIGIDLISVKVQGKVKKEGHDIALYSTGDNTRFVLVSPYRAPATIQKSVPNASQMSLSPDLTASILDAAKKNKTIVVEGPLYRPWESPPMLILIERFQAI